MTRVRVAARFPQFIASQTEKVMRRLKIHQALHGMALLWQPKRTKCSEHIAMTASARPRLSLWTAIKLCVVEHEHALVTASERNCNAAQKPKRIETGQHCRRFICRSDQQHA